MKLSFTRSIIDAIHSGDLANAPTDFSWLQLYGAALLCGVGFTMSLFIGSLAFENTGVNQLFDERLGIIVGSLLSGLTGYVILRSSVTGTGCCKPASDRAQMQADHRAPRRYNPPQCPS